MAKLRKRTPMSSRSLSDIDSDIKSGKGTPAHKREVAVRMIQKEQENKANKVKLAKAGHGVLTKNNPLYNVKGYNKTREVWDGKRLGSWSTYEKNKSTKAKDIPLYKTKVGMKKTIKPMPKKK